jgi:hypothetical protein
MRADEMKVGDVGYVSLGQVCTDYRIVLATGERQGKADYQNVPVGEGTSYFLRSHAEVHSVPEHDAVIRVTRHPTGVVIGVPSSIEFNPRPLNDMTTELIPILNERHCLDANRIPLA